MAIGLSVLAYHYQGLRSGDVHHLLKTLKKLLLLEPGAYPFRPTRRLFDNWISNAQIHKNSSDILHLELIQPHDKTQLANVRRLVGFSDIVIRYFLSEIVFPLVLKSKQNKLQSNGVDLGGDMLFGSRFGFSGTPRYCYVNLLLLFL